MLIRWLLCMCIAFIASSSYGQKRGEDISLTPEAEVLSAYMRAATCLVLKASAVEKTQLIAGLPFVDRTLIRKDGASYLINDVDRAVKLRLRAERALYEVLPRRCPQSYQQLTFRTSGLDRRTRLIYEAHFADLVAGTLAINIAAREELRKYFEMEHEAPGLENKSPY